jgi:hypothetical protein
MNKVGFRGVVAALVISAFVGAGVGFASGPASLEAGVGDELCDTHQDYCLQQGGCTQGCVNLSCSFDEDCPEQDPGDERRCYACWIPN